MQLLQDENRELEHYINRLGTRIPLALATVHPHAKMHTVQVRSKRFPVHVRVEIGRAHV